MRRFSVLLGILAIFASPVSRRFIDRNQYLLGETVLPEWQSFDRIPRHGPQLHLRFQSHANPTEYALYIRQSDVKQRWEVRLNDSRLGALELMEYPLVHSLGVPKGALKEGENMLTIRSGQTGDDILVSDFSIDPHPLEQSLRQASLYVEVEETGTGRGVPCRLTVADLSGALAPLRAEGKGSLAVRTGVVYTSDGRARIFLPPGSYVLYASRGFEYGIDRRQVTLAAGDTRRLRMSIRREVPTPGWASCDTHIHTLEYSGHGDASAAERMVTIAGEGIELPIATEHNRAQDYAADAAGVFQRAYFTPVAGSEITTRRGHFNVLPLEPGGRFVEPELPQWPAIVSVIRTLTKARVVILNHPRDLHSGFRPFDESLFNPVTGENTGGSDFSFDALEVINSGALQSDPMQLYRDWFALLNYGYRMAAVAGSDSHDVSRYILGQARTYLRCADIDGGRLDPEEAVSSLLQGRSLISMGLLTQVTVDGRFQAGDLAAPSGPSAIVEVAVSGPSWTRADRVELFANGTKIRSEPVKPTARVEKARVRWTVELPGHDVFLVAIASGPGVEAPHWPMAKPYQPISRSWNPRVLGSTGPIRIDCDRDGRFTAAREYAKAVVQGSGSDPAKVVPALGSYDEAVAAQAASLLRAAGHEPLGEEVSRILSTAPERVRKGFEAYAASLKSGR